MLQCFRVSPETRDCRQSLTHWAWHCPSVITCKAGETQGIGTLEPASQKSCRRNFVHNCCRASGVRLTQIIRASMASHHTAARDGDTRLCLRCSFMLASTCKMCVRVPVPVPVPVPGPVFLSLLP